MLVLSLFGACSGGTMASGMGELLVAVSVGFTCDIFVERMPALV